MQIQQKTGRPVQFEITTDTRASLLAWLDALREVGFTDLNIAAIALAASFRNFLSRYFDAVGARPRLTFLMATKAFEMSCLSVAANLRELLKSPGLRHPGRYAARGVAVTG